MRFLRAWLFCIYFRKGVLILGIFKRLGWFFKEQKKRYVIGVLALFVTAIMTIVPPKVIGSIVDAISQRNLKPDFLCLMLLIFLLSSVMRYLMRYVWRKYIFGTSFILERQIRSRLFQHFMKMDQTFYANHRVGDLMAHATNDVDAVREVAGSGILTLADSLMTGCSTLIAMCIFVDWRLTILAIIPLPFLALEATYLGKKIHDAFSDAQAAFSDLNNKTQESITGVKVIKTLGQEKQDIEDFERHVDKTIAADKKSIVIDSLFDPVTTIILGFSYIMTIVYGGSSVLNGTISIGQLVSFVSYLSELIWPMFAIGRLFNILERGTASYDRIMLLLGEKNHWVQPKLEEHSDVEGELAFDIKEFKYPDQKGRGVNLQNVKFEVKPGKVLGIVGRTGAGKSTILRLLMREFDSYDGKITFGSHDIRDYQMQDFLTQIGYVPQTSFLFSTSIRENVRFAKPLANQKEVEKAAYAADLDEDIVQMQEGYDTEVGEMGVSLSGGQKQRLAIARALMVSPELLILDDSLSAVDAKTEKHILERIKKNRADRTTIMVASRLSSVMGADEIIVIDHGTVVERGTHEQLAKNGGWYQKTFEMQRLEQNIGKGDEA